MTGFKDRTGRAWSVELTYGELRAIHLETGVDLRACLENDAAILKRCFTDVYFVGDCLVVACRRQMKADGVDADDFVYSLGNESTLEEAHAAFLAALCDFFQEPKRSIIRGMIDKARAIGKAAQAIATRRAATIVDAIDVDAAAAKLTGTKAKPDPPPPKKRAAAA